MKLFEITKTIRRRSLYEFLRNLTEKRSFSANRAAKPRAGSLIAKGPNSLTLLKLGAI
jgi:hypothetical protein